MRLNVSSFATAILETIREEECWAIGSHFLNGRALHLLEDTTQLSQLCTACFWASMEREERREVRGTLAICSPQHGLLARHLTSEVPVTVPNLVSLLTASPSSPLAVHGGADGPHIWGMLDAAPDEVVRLRITGNGALQASQSGNVLALYQRGVVSTPEAADVKSLGHLMARSLDKKHFLEIQSDIPTRIIRMVVTMIHHGQGGTLVVVDPHDRSWMDSVRFAFTFSNATPGNTTAGNHGYGTDVYKYLNNYNTSISMTKEEQLTSPGLQKIHPNYLQNFDVSLFNRVSELSLVDGAVVIDMNLKLYGFGAKLESSQSNCSITALNAVTGELEADVSLSQLGGMRHQSAASFVNKNRCADVFVVSQDGRLSLFCWSAKLNNVAVVQDLEHFIWEFQPLNNLSLADVKPPE